MVPNPITTDDLCICVQRQVMEMTESGKPWSRLSTLFGNPCGITTFPRPLRRGGCLEATAQKNEEAHVKVLASDPHLKGEMGAPAKGDMMGLRLRARVTTPP